MDRINLVLAILITLLGVWLIVDVNIVDMSVVFAGITLATTGSVAVFLGISNLKTSKQLKKYE